jgi:glycosyltransferase involved in cell wall biosynthesis
MKMRAQRQDSSGNQIALAHHWLVGMRGGEKVLEHFDRLFPAAPIYTLVAQPENLTPELRRHRIHESALRILPGVEKHYKKLLPLFPPAFHGLRVSSSTRFLLSSDASVAKGLQYDPAIPHVCYCHSPARYLWGMQETYLQHTAGLNGPGRAVFRSVVPYVRRFDYQGAQRVTHFIANSRFVQERIRASYDREATVIHPPVAIDDFRWDRANEDFYLVVSELVPYKRIDLAVDAFNASGKKLVVIGGGSELAMLQSRAKANISFLGRQPFSVLKDHYERCRALIFPGIEDFGITPLEAQAAGRPVIAYGEGGALETVVSNVTGRFFHAQTVEALAEAVDESENQWFDPDACRRNAERFSPQRFRTQIKAFLEEKLPEVFAGYSWPC